MKPIEKRFSESKLRLIKANLTSDNEEQLIYYNLEYYNRISNLIGIILMVIFIVSFRQIGESYNWLNWVGPVIGIVFGAIAYFVILVVISYKKRQFYYKYRDEILKYVREQLKNIK